MPFRRKAIGRMAALAFGARIRLAMWAAAASTNIRTSSGIESEGSFEVLPSTMRV
jgi:hypothetical protein